MALIPPSFIDELLARADLVELIGSRVPLKRAGREYTACCPFHNEKTPSFTVSPEKQFYHCFGCGAHGTAIGFLMAYDRLEFREAVESLAERVGLHLPESAAAAPAADSAPLHDVLERAARFYAAQLRTEAGAAAVEYLRSRGMTGVSAARFGLGYAPPEWEALVRHLGPGTAVLQAAERAGLLLRNERGGWRDRFRGRLMFPIRNRRGQVVGFGGRVLDDSKPKYLNSPETPVFHKGRELYGLYEARQAGELSTVLVVEGYLDVVLLAQHGITHAVAALGTAVSSSHLEQLFRQSRQLVFCFDGDAAGQRAAERALQIGLGVLRAGREVRFLFLPAGEDPDTLVRREGGEAFRQRLEQTVLLSQFLVDDLLSRHSPTSPEARARLAQEAQSRLAAVPDALVRDELARTLAHRAGLDAGQWQQESSARSNPLAAPLQRTSLRLAIALLLQQPALARTGEALTLPPVEGAGGALLAELLALLQTEPHLQTASVLERWRERREYSTLARLAAWPLDLEPEQRMNEWCQVLSRLEQQALRAEVRRLLAQDYASLSPEQKRRLSTLYARRTGRPIAR